MILITDPPFDRLGLRRDSKRRIRFFAVADRDAPSLIEYGVMFIMAWWSAPARLAWKLLRETLDRLDPEERIELVVVDIDRATNLFKHPSIDRASAGAGEIAWVISGRVVKFSIDPFHHPDEVEHLTKWLLWRGPAQ